MIVRMMPLVGLLITSGAVSELASVAHGFLTLGSGLIIFGFINLLVSFGKPSR